MENYYSWINGKHDGSHSIQSSSKDGRKRMPCRDLSRFEGIRPVDVTIEIDFEGPTPPEFAVAEDSRLVTNGDLVKHDKEYHPNGWKKGDRCKLREYLEEVDKADDLSSELDAMYKKTKMSEYYDRSDLRCDYATGLRYYPNGFLALPIRINANARWNPRTEEVELRLTHIMRGDEDILGNKADWLIYNTLFKMREKGYKYTGEYDDGTICFKKMTDEEMQETQEQVKKNQAYFPGISKKQ